MKNITIKKLACMVILALFTLQTANANPAWLLRHLLVNGVKQTTKRTVVKKTGKKTVTKLAANAVTVASLASLAGKAGASTVSDFEYNEHGFILEEGGEIIYAGKSCDAYSPVYGNGVWGWNNDGWVIIMEDSYEQTIFQYKRKDMPKLPQYILDSCKIVG